MSDHGCPPNLVFGLNQSEPDSGPTQKILAGLHARTLPMMKVGCGEYPFWTVWVSYTKSSHVRVGDGMEGKEVTQNIRSYESDRSNTYIHHEFIKCPRSSDLDPNQLGWPRTPFSLYLDPGG